MAAGFRDLFALVLGWHSSAEETAPTKPGLEFTLPGMRMHFRVPEQKMHFEVPLE